MSESYRQFRIGVSYDVRKSFRDFDGVEVAAGARFTVTALSFLPYDDGLTLRGSLFMPGAAPRGWGLRMQDRPETQLRLIDGARSPAACPVAPRYSPCAMTSVCVVVNSRKPSNPFSRP